MSNKKTPNNKRWFATWWGLLIIGVSVLFVVGVGYFVFLVVTEISALADGDLSRYETEITENEDSSQARGVVRADISIEGRPYQGNPEADIVIVEFSDFQCPFCKKEFPIVRKVMLDYKEDILYVYRHFPLSSAHPDAQKAAEASECAFAQGKFWEYHDMLFINSEQLEVDALKGYAERIGLDTNRFNACLDSGEMAGVVAKDIADGKAAGVSGTPTFFINGNRVTGALPEDFFIQAIEHLR